MLPKLISTVVKRADVKGLSSNPVAPKNNNKTQFKRNKRSECLENFVF
jgi:hypothetical protein